MNIFEVLTGKFIGSTSTFLAASYYDNYTILFILSFTLTGLTPPPFLTQSSCRKSLNARNAQSDD